ncbi:SAM-dependent methyltransferase [Streptomyces sp. NPDC051784]|uniref:SAM-dependent methyltransferase n=1 Tax=Streptomyces sp. NPDC051784 TaxID=3155805 RepID=UPI00341AA999
MFPDESFEQGKPHPARVYDSLLGGKDNYPVDQAVAEGIAQRWPEIQRSAQQNRAWMARAVRHMVKEGGVTQFLDIGTGIPTRPNLHEIAQGMAPSARIVYVDNDPVVLRHAEALLTPISPEGRSTYLQADLRDPRAVLESPEVTGTLDMTRPVGLVLAAILHFLDDDEDPAGVLRVLVDALPAGSYVALSHACGDADPVRAAEASAFYRQNKVSKPVVLRTQKQIEEFFTGLELLEPGVVPVDRWRPDASASEGPDDMGFRGGVGLKHGTVNPR